MVGMGAFCSVNEIRVGFFIVSLELSNIVSAFDLGK